MRTLETIQVCQGTFDLQSIIDECCLRDQDTAVHICDLSNIVSKYNNWIRLMPNIMPYYAEELLNSVQGLSKTVKLGAVKCNNEQPVLKTLRDLGTGVDCASKMEMEECLSLGFEADKIIFANPIKSISHIQYAKANNVTDSTVDNEFEIYKIFKQYPESNVVVRFRSDGKKVIRSLGKKFGCNAEEDGVALMLLAKSLDVNVNGVSFHVGTHCSDLLAYDKAIKTGSYLHKAGKLIKHNMKLFDIGGGFPGDNDVLFCKIAEIVTKSLNKYINDDKVQIIAEPGRYFVSSAYTTICKIFAKRELRDCYGKLKEVMYFINDGTYGTFCGHLLEGLDVDKIIHFGDADSETFNSSIWGPTCDSADMIFESIYLPNLKLGDFIAFPNTGAYSLTRSCNFNGFESPTTRLFVKNECQLSLYTQNHNLT